MNTPIIEQVVEQMKDLSQDMQWRVLEFTRALAISAPQGVPGSQLLQFAGAISPEDAKKMRDAIEQGCEQVDVNEW
jgi:hypothetical protein